MKSESTKGIWKVFLGLCLMVTALMSLWGTQKKGFFVDEEWSYGLANSYYRPHIYWNGLEDQWEPGSYFEEYIEVDEGEQFRYDSVVYNLKNDAHPPLFFMVLHTVSSFFPETFSKWYALAPNILYCLVAMFLVLRISQKLFRSNRMALLTAGLWGFALGTANMVVYLRMYMMSAMFALLTLNFHYNLLIKKKYDVKHWFLLILCSFAGYMTHYYFFIYAFFLSAFFVFGLLAQKKVKELIWYCSSMMASLLVVLVLAPWAFENLFGNGYSQQAAGGLDMGIVNFLWYLWEYAWFFARDFFGNHLIIPALMGAAGVAAGIACFAKKRTKMFTEKKETTMMVILLFAPAIFYFIIAAVCSPFMSSRYIYAVYPMLFLMVIWLCYAGLKGFGVTEKKILAGVGVVTLVCTLVSYSDAGVDYLYQRQEQTYEAMEPYYGSDCAFLSYNYYRITEKCDELSHMNRVWTSQPTDEKIREMAETVNPELDQMIIYVEDMWPEANGQEKMDNILKDVIKYTDFNNYERIPDYVSNYGYGLVAYRVYK